MKLNHLNLPVENVAEARQFFEQYFGFRTFETRGDNLLSVLLDEHGFTLVLMANSFNRHGNSSYPDAHHIGFLVATKAEVEGIYDKLNAGGIPLEQSPSNMRGVYGFYFHAPGNILTEVSCALN